MSVLQKNVIKLSFYKAMHWSHFGQYILITCTVLFIKEKQWEDIKLTNINYGGISTDTIIQVNIKHLCRGGN